MKENDKNIDTKYHIRKVGSNADSVKVNVGNAATEKLEGTLIECTNNEHKRNSIQISDNNKDALHGNIGVEVESLSSETRNNAKIGERKEEEY